MHTEKPTDNDAPAHVRGAAAGGGRGGQGRGSPRQRQLRRRGTARPYRAEKRRTSSTSVRGAVVVEPNPHDPLGRGVDEHRVAFFIHDDDAVADAIEDRLQDAGLFPQSFGGESQLVGLAGLSLLGFFAIAEVAQTKTTAGRLFCGGRFASWPRPRRVMMAMPAAELEAGAARVLGMFRKPSLPGGARSEIGKSNPNGFPF